MCDPADVAERAVESEMRRGVGGGEQAADVRAVLDGDESDIVALEIGIGNAARLDRHHALHAVDAADVAEASVGEPARVECDVRLEDPPAELVERRPTDRRSPAPGRWHARSPTR
jgi:hypothetical protein